MEEYTGKSVDELKSLNKDLLKDICMHYGIKGYSNKNRLGMAQLLHRKFNPETMIIHRGYKNKCKVEIDIDDYDSPIRIKPDMKESDIQLSNRFYVDMAYKLEDSNLDDESIKMVKKYLNFFYGSDIKYLIFELDRINKNKLLDTFPAVIWEDGVDENQKQYYMHWKNILLEKELVDKDIIAYNNGNDIMVSDTLSPLLKIAGNLKIGRYFTTISGREPNLKTDSILLLPEYCPNTLIGEAPGHKITDPLEGSYVRGRRWIKGYFTTEHSNKVYFVEFLIDTGSKFSWVLPETRSILGLKVDHGFHNPDSPGYKILIANVEIHVLESEICKHKGVRNINLLGTDFLRSFMMIDNHYKKSLIVTQAALVEEVIILNKKSEGAD